MVGQRQVHFLYELKEKPTNQTLTQVGCEGRVGEVFKQERLQQGEGFMKVVTSMERELALVMVYCKHLEIDPQHTLQHIILHNDIPLKNSRLLESPLDSVPHCALVSLYEHI